MQALELLSPAKNLECGKRAIEHGADAVYIGASRFGARAAAGNSIEDIKELCDYAHVFGAKVYVTVNTIIYDKEFRDTISLCKQLEDIGVDALLLQDMGLLSILRNEIGIPLHASTQTDNRSAEKVKWLKAQGFSRVVLARELSIDEIANIHKQVPEAELEVFVHGALCVSYSGQCYASSYCFNRSANRGECSQFCRMRFTLSDANGNVLSRNRYLLSLKDMAQLHNMERLADAGAISFKIEGRLKDADYVSNVTAAYSEQLNSLCKRLPQKYCRASMGRCSYNFTPNIEKSFNRSFTTYFSDGRQKSMASIHTPKAIGEHIGKVVNKHRQFIETDLKTNLSAGDGLCFFNLQKELIGFRVNKVEGNRVYPRTMPQDLTNGMTLYRNHDQSFTSLLSKPSSVRKIYINMVLHITEDTIDLHITDERGNESIATLPYTYQKAETSQEENLYRTLTKLGNTPYICEKLTTVSSLDIPFIQNSLLTKLKREAIEKLRYKHKPISIKQQENNTEPPNYILPHLYNAANKYAKDFYKEQGIEATAFEPNAHLKGKKLIMQCRYCIRYEFGQCHKLHRDSTKWKDPLCLRLDNGDTFNVVFNCKECQMNIWAE